MKKYLLLILPLFVLILSFSKKEQKEVKKHQILIVSYNVENLFDTLDSPFSLDEEFTSMSYKNWNSERYNKKLLDLATVLSSIDKNQLPDIIALSEVENRQVVEDLISQPLLASKNYQIVHEETTDPRGIDLALVYNPEVFEYITHKQLPVFDDDGKLYKSREILEIKGLVGGDTLFVYLNHWKSRSGGAQKTEYKRIWAAEVLKKQIENVFAFSPNANIICMGDFNDTPFDKSINEVLDASLDSVFDSKNELFNLTALLAKNGLGTYNYNYNWFLLDNIIVSQSFLNKRNSIYANSGAKIYKGKEVIYYNPKANDSVPGKTYGGNSYFGGISDHFAVYSYFTIKKK